MLLRRVEITDFLSIKGKLPIDFDKKVSILLGANDHGKSNILAAIEHLNEDKPITQDEENWDAKGVPTISFQFSLDETEKKEWKTIVEKIQAEIAERAAALQAETEKENVPEGAATAVAGGSSSTSPSPGKKPKAPAPQLAGDNLPAAILNPAATTMTLTRTGVDAALQLEGVDIGNLTKEMQDFFQRRTPRVELFKPLTSALQDSAKESTITTEDSEFLQGVFFYAGLDPMKSSHLFTQDDETIRALDNASKKLDGSLRKLWGQGTDLRFHLRHKGSDIEFLADDPAIATRVARMSKRSAGVTQFFRVSMVLYARRSKHPANSYIYLFDEPGVFLHPSGQRDLLQVFETLADENQIVYATHSLFLLNQNFPERHKLIYKDQDGTKVDQKPYRQNWKLATDALGIYLSSNIVFANKVLLVEGDSDPIFLYELFRQLNSLNETDVDLNTLGIMSFSDYQNLRFLLQIFKKEGQEGTSVLTLVDGDWAGRAIARPVEELCRRLAVQIVKLPDGRSIEDFALLEEQFLAAVKMTLQNACEMEEKPVPADLEAKIRKSWDEYRGSKDKPEKKEKAVPAEAGEKAEKAEKEKAKEKPNAGRWFKNLTKELLNDEASKVVLARIYAEFCRDAKELAPNRERIKEAKVTCQDIATKLGLSPVKARKAIESK